MIRPQTRHLRTVLTLASLAAGCDVFDPRLYRNATAVDMTAPASHPEDAGADMARFDHDAGGVLCGRTTPATLCPSTYLFCDGFETETGTDFMLWTNFLDQSANGGPNPGTNIVIADAPVCLGKKALHTKTVGATQQSFVFRTLKNPPSTLHVRFYFYMTQFSQQPFQIVGFHAPSNDYATLYADPIGSSFHYANSFTGLTANFNGAHLPVNQWLCLELTTRFDTHSGEVQLALDGTQLGDVAGAPTEPASTLDTVNVGIIYTAPGDNGTNDVFFDEVAFSPDPIGCL